MNRAPGGPVGRGRVVAAPMVAALTLGSAVVACGGDDERERAHVLVRVDALRDATGAPADDRRRLLEALRSAKGDAPTIAAVRDRCVTAYADLIEANAIEEGARAAMATGEKVDTLLLAKQLETATRLLESSRASMPACDRAVTDLRAEKP